MFKFNVLIYDSNSHKIRPYNIITNSLLDDIKKQRRKKVITNKVSLMEYLKKEFMFHYWSRTEYEILMSGLHMNCEPEKIDVWKQIEMNLELIADSIIKELKFKF